MPRLGPSKRKELISCLRELGFEGPYSGGKHQFMILDDITVRIPNPHQGDIGIELLKRIPRQAGIDGDRWRDL
jgi:predicted RNA binding protein YcfA (HicA-like mRNA interferase family)